MHSRPLDRKSTRLNSSHPSISYAVFCLKKKNSNLDKLIGQTNQFMVIKFNKKRRNLDYVIATPYQFIVIKFNKKRFIFVLSFFFNDTATTEIYTLSLHDALPISRNLLVTSVKHRLTIPFRMQGVNTDRKSTRLNSSHPSISYAVFCLKKKKK